MKPSNQAVRNEIEKRRMKVCIGNKLQDFFGRMLADVKDEALVDKQTRPREIPETAQCAHQQRDRKPAVSTDSLREQRTHPGGVHRALVIGSDGALSKSVTVTSSTARRCGHCLLTRVRRLVPSADAMRRFASQ